MVIFPRYPVALIFTGHWVLQLAAKVSIKAYLRNDLLISLGARSLTFYRWSKLPEMTQFYTIVLKVNVTYMCNIVKEIVRKKEGRHDKLDPSD